MLKLTILQGLPASGKSTFAKEKAKEERRTVIINRDKIREMLKGEYKNFPFNSRMEELVTLIENYSIQMALMTDYSVISDGTNFRFTDWKAIDICKKVYDATGTIVNHEFIKFDTDVEECIRRDKERENVIGEDVIRNMYNKYLNND